MAQITPENRKRMIAIHEDAAKTARLYNFGEAVSVRTATGKPAYYIPVAPSPRDGGRPSVYDLPVKRETLMGTYVTTDGFVHELMTRTSEDGYEMRQVTGNGDVEFEGVGTLEVLNAEIGHGRIAWKPKGVASKTQGPVRVTTTKWRLWSCRKEETTVEF